MAEKSPVHSEHVHCANCAKLKENHCEEIKIALEECSRFKEEVRIEKEQAVSKELKEAKTKINKLQRTVSAFQIATTVGVTILGQEAFDKIFHKVEEVQKVQEKINGIVPDEKQKSSATTPATESKDLKKTVDAFSLNKINIFDYFRPTQAGLGINPPVLDAKIIVTETSPTNTPWIPLTPKIEQITSIPIIPDPPVQPFTFSKSSILWEMPMPIMAENVNAWMAPPDLEFSDQGGCYVNYNNSAIPQASSPGVYALLGFALFMSRRRRT